MSPRNLPDLWPHETKIVFTDIDDTLTWKGQLPFETFKVLYDLREAGIRVMPVTGGSAGWADCLIRTWPIDTIITENGSMWFSKDATGNVGRHYFLSEALRMRNWQRLWHLKGEFHKAYPTIPETEDQAFRLTDIAFDIGQQVTVERSLALEAANWWKDYGALARCSSIHINVWIGDYNKAIGALKWLRSQGLESQMDQCAFIGDSPNDEAMFTHFEHTVGVANISPFLNDLEEQPRYITQANGGYGFVEFAKTILANL